MKDAFIAAALIYAAVSGLYFGYAGVMNFKRGLDAGTLPRWVVIAVGVWVLAFYCLDVLINWTVMCLVFLEIPWEPTVSERLSRLERSTGWRGDWAHWICKLLDPLDPSGEHCK